MIINSNILIRILDDLICNYNYGIKIDYENKIMQILDWEYEKGNTVVIDLLDECDYDFEVLIDALQSGKYNLSSIRGFSGNFSKLVRDYSNNVDMMNLINPDIKEIPDDYLSKFESFICFVNTENVSLEELYQLVNELPTVLDKMKLNDFTLSIENHKKEPVNLNTDFIMHLNSDIKAINLFGINMSNKDSSLFSKFEKLHEIRINNCNISNFSIISELTSKVVIELDGNKLDENMSINEIVAEIQKREGKMKITSNYFSIYKRIANAISKKRRQVDLRGVEIDDTLIETIQKLNNFEFIVDSKTWKELVYKSENLTSRLKLYGKHEIFYTSDLDIKTLELNPDITEVKIIGKR